MSYPTTWNPTNDRHPATLAGKVTTIREDVPTEYGKRTVAEIDGENGEWSLWISPYRLRQLWAKHNPRTGDRIRLEYLGTRPAGEGNRYQHYQMHVTRREQTRIEFESTNEPTNP